MVPLGFYTLAATSIAMTDLPDELTRRLPRYPSISATLMGRLAVDARHRGRRLGELLLFEPLVFRATGQEVGQEHRGRHVRIVVEHHAAERAVEQVAAMLGREV